MKPNPATALSGDDVQPPAERPLPALRREQLGRLRAEWELAALRAEIARAALTDTAAEVARELGLPGAFDIDFARGVLVARAASPTNKE